jgi:RecQ-mediated genome instability protein 1
MSIGCKILLKRGCIVARGVVLLEPGSVAVLGGRIEVLDKVWRERRESVLRERVKKEKGEKEAGIAG